MERKYTLDEARRELARQECREHGHDFGHTVDTTGAPTKVVCERCGDVWTVESSRRATKIGDDVQALVENIAAGHADHCLEAILAASHGRKRALRGCAMPYGRA